MSSLLLLTNTRFLYSKHFGARLVYYFLYLQLFFLFFLFFDFIVLLFAPNNTIYCLFIFLFFLLYVSPKKVLIILFKYLQYFFSVFLPIFILTFYNNCVFFLFSFKFFKKFPKNFSLISPPSLSAVIFYFLHPWFYFLCCSSLCFVSSLLLVFVISHMSYPFPFSLAL